MWRLSARVCAVDWRSPRGGRRGAINSGNALVWSTGYEYQCERLVLFFMQVVVAVFCGADVDVVSANMIGACFPGVLVLAIVTIFFVLCTLVAVVLAQMTSPAAFKIFLYDMI